MELTTFVETLRQELAHTVEGQDEQARAVAERLVAGLEPAVRLAMLEALSTAADEITRELAPGSVHVRLRGREPSFMVTLPPAEDVEPAAPAPGSPPETPDAQDGATVRINVRLNEQLKHRVEQAADRAGLSVNAWLGRAARTVLDAEDPSRVATSPIRRSATGGQRYTGWAR